MGVDLQTYRCRIGCNKFLFGVDVVTLHIYIQFSGSFRTIGSVLFIGLLLLIAGIESNPGPRDSDAMDSSQTTNDKTIDQAMQSYHPEEALFSKTKILATALPKDIGKECMEQFFSEIVQEVGKVTDIEVNTANCSAVIEFDSQEGADHVLRRPCYTLEGQELKVEPYTVYSEDCLETDSTDVESESRAQDILQKKQTEMWSNFNEFLGLLGLQEMFLNRITITDVVGISTDGDINKVVTLKELPWMLLKGIVFVNSNIRDSILSTLSSENNQETVAAYDLDDIFDDDEYDNQGVSPLDIFTAVLQCCEPVLKKLLYQKLYLCKKALPFINVQYCKNWCSPTFIVWPLRSLQVESMLSCNEDKPKETEIGVLNLPTKVITFARFGRPRFSKSNLINVLMSDRNANTFFSKECKYGSAERKFTQGLVEIAWLPKVGNKNDKFDDAMIFLNCRGNVEVYSDENVIQSVANISDAVVLFVDINSVYSNIPELSKYLSYFRHSILVIASPINNKQDIESIKRFANIAKETHMLKTFKRENELSTVDIASSLQKLLDLKIKDIKVKPLKDRIQILMEHNEIIIDEDDEVCRKCKSLAVDLIKQIESNGTDIRREVLTPVQSNIAPQLGRSMKLLHRLLTDDDNQHHRVQSDILEMRKNVLCCIKPFVKKFVKTLVELDSSSARQLLIEWLKILINDRKTLKVSSLIQENVSNKKKLKQMRNDVKFCIMQVHDIEQQIKLINAEINDLSFNVEHLFREIGYIYDTAIVLNEDLTDKGLPPALEVANVLSDFIITGNSFELIDGDSFLLPVRWVETLFHSVSKRLGNNKVFALSVLGLQSSGKSTLLNTMFGSQFRASAGRCTKGINIQLFPIKSEKKIPATLSPFSFNFVLLIDTEGLRAPELCDQNLDHDNELATVIAGLGDITILNIKGENTSEINDILRVIVHAFLRLKLANENLDIRKSCYFIHQNVSSILASEKRRQGLETFKKALDKATKDSAAIENILNVSSFNEIIEFDINTHVWNMPNLWQGNPPVEFVNPDYSDGVVTVKYNILQNALKKKGKSYKSLNDIAVHTKDLWIGVLSEDFVFSFRNSLEIKAYVDLSDELHKQLRQVERIMNDEYISQSVTKVFQCESEKSLENTLNELKVGVVKSMKEKKADLELTIQTFIDNVERREITEKWRETTYLQIDTFCDELLCHLKQEIDYLSSKRRTDLLTQSRKVEEDLYERSMQVAMKFKGKEINEKDIENKFEEIWSSVYTEEKTIHDTSHIQTYCHECLNKLLPRHRYTLLVTQLETYDSLLSTQKHLQSLSGTFENMSVEQICQPQHGFGFPFKRKDIVEQTREEVESLFTDIDQLLCRFCRENHEITRSQVNRFFDNVYSMVKTLQGKTANELLGNIKFTVKLLVHISMCANNLFAEHNTRCYKRMTSNRDQYKAKALRIFKAHIDDRKVEEKAAIEFSSIMQRRVKDVIDVNLPGRIKTALCSAIPTVKYHLLLEVLTDLTHKKDFNLFKKYSENPKAYVKEWIHEKANNYLFGEDTSKYYEIICFVLTTYFNEIKDAVLVSIEAFPEETFSINAWIKTFAAKEHTCQTTSESLHLLSKMLCHKVDVNCFKDNILEKLKESQIELERNLKHKSECLFVNEITTGTIDSVTKSVWGCPMMCPFCGEPCALDKKHRGSKHYALQHKPKGIRGFHNPDGKHTSITSCNVDVAKRNKYYKCKSIGYKCNQENKKEKCKKGEHRFFDYRELFPSWDIKPMTDMEESSKFWMWFMSTYKHEIAQNYSVKVKNIPADWAKISQDEALDSLRDIYK